MPDHHTLQHRNTQINKGQTQREVEDTNKTIQKIETHGSCYRSYSDGELFVNNLFTYLHIV